MKKKELTVILAVLMVFLIGAVYLEAGILKEEMLQRQSGVVDAEAENSTVEEWDMMQASDSEEILISGAVETDDYPYGYNVGFIEDDEVGKAFLITPGTEVTIKTEKIKGSQLMIQYFIHPWVAQDSDGAVLKGVITNEDDITEEFEYSVSSESASQYINITGKELKLYVVNEEGKNSDCDWVIIGALKTAK